MLLYHRRKELLKPSLSFTPEELLVPVSLVVRVNRMEASNV